MRLVRRQFLHLAGGAAAVPMTAQLAKAEAFPVRLFPPNYLHDSRLDYLYWDTALDP